MHRPVARFFFLFAAAISLLLCLTAAVLWPWSYRQHFALMRINTSAYRAVGNSRGSIYATSYVELGGAQFGDKWELASRPAVDLLDVGIRPYPQSHPSVAGFFIGHRNGPVISRSIIIVPAWSVIILTALLPISVARSIHRRRTLRQRLSAGHCPACGYDCRATPGRCSECGQAFAQSAPV